MPKMKIFNSLEKEAFDSPPMFNSVERKQFFSLPLLLKDSVTDLRTPTNQVCFLAVAGYFKARRKFFARQFHRADIEYIARQIGVSPADVHVGIYSKGTYARHQAIILSYFGCNPFDGPAKRFIASEIATLVRVQYRPKLVLMEVLQILTRQKIEIPSYNVLAGLIVTSINRHRSELSAIVEAGLSKKQRASLDALLEKEPDKWTSEGWRYRLTLLKRPFQSTRPIKKSRANLADLSTLQTLYLDLKPLVEHLDLSYECARYYAYSVIKAQIPQVSRRADHDRLLHLIAFVAYQTFKLNDTLIDTLLSAMQAAVNSAVKTPKEVYSQEREQRSQSLSGLADKLRQSVRETLSSIRHIVADTQLRDSQKVALIDAVVNTENTTANVETQIDEFKKNVTKLQQGQDYFTLLESHSLKLQHRVADIVRQIQFAPNSSLPTLWKALQHYQQKDGKIDKSALVDFLSVEQRAALIATDGKFRVSLYKALLYVGIADSIKSGALNLAHSGKYRALDEYLIPKADWNVHRSEYLQRA